MARSDKEKALVDAILDGHLDAKEIAEKATELGVSMAKQLTTITRAIVKRAREGRMTTDAARNAYRLAYLSFSLAGFTKVAEKVMATAERDVASVKKAIKALGGDIAKVEAIRKVDTMAREAERKGVADGQQS